jgi:ATP/maltotriose-dependent transcriptional regulator MalT
MDEPEAWRLAIDTANVYERSGDLRPGLVLLDRLEGHDLDDRARARMASARANLLVKRREFDEARELLDRSIAALRGFGEHLEVSRDLTTRGSLAYWRGDHDLAMRDFEASLEQAEQVDSDYFAAVACSNLCFLGALHGDAHRAHGFGSRALDTFRRARDRRAEATTLGFLGMLNLNLDQLDEAETAFEDALVVHRLTGERLQEGFSLANLAHVATIRGESRRALALIEQSERLGRQLETPIFELHNAETRAQLALQESDVGRAIEEFTRALGHPQIGTIPYYHLHFLARRGALRARRGDLESGHADLQAAADVSERCAQPHYLAAFGVYRSVTVDFDHEEWDEVGAHLANVLQVTNGDHPNVANSILVRDAVREVRPGWSDAARLDVAARVEDPAGRALVYTDETARFRLPGGAWLDLTNRSTLAPMLFALIEASVRGEALDNDALFEAVWPGEVADPDAAANRIYNAVALLRRSGLGEILVKGPEGYHLDGTVELRRLP